MKEYNYKGSLYWVEKDGTIISQKTGKTLKPRIDPDGYSIGVLSDEDKKCSIGWLVNDVGNVFK